MNDPVTAQGVAVVGQNGPGVIICLSRVDHHGKGEFARQAELRFIVFGLSALIGLLLIVVEPDLTDGDNAVVTRAFFYPLGGGGTPAVRFVRMDALSAPDLGMTRGELSHDIEIISGHRNGDDALNSSGLCRR